MRQTIGPIHVGKVGVGLDIPAWVVADINWFLVLSRGDRDDVVMDCAVGDGWLRLLVAAVHLGVHVSHEEGLVIDILVLLDWMLPESSGIELLHRLREDDLTRKIPVIMLTAKVSEQNIVRGLEVGADDYITKPFSPKP